MSLYQQFETNKKAEVEGVWVEFGPNSKGKEIGIKLARMGKSNVAYKKALEKAMRPHKRQIETETLSNEKAEEIILKVFAEVIVLDWKNVESRDLKPLEFNKNNVVKLLTDLPDLYEQLLKDSEKATLFKKESLEADSKN